MTRRLLCALIIAIAMFLVACRGSTVVERIPLTVVVTAEVPQVTREVTVVVTAPVTVIVTRVVPTTVFVTTTPLPAPGAALSNAAAEQAALRWLIGQQRNDGGFTTVRNTAWATLALATAGVNPEDVLPPTGRHALEYLRGVISMGLAGGAEVKAVTALALAGSGQGVPEALGLRELPIPDTWPALPLLVWALGADAPDEMVSALLDAQGDDGGFGSATNTALAILALAAAGEEAPLAEALGALRERQLTGGGWAAGDDEGEPDALATALAIQALAAVSQDLRTWGDPVRALLALQQRDGSFGGDVVTTAAAIIAIQQAWALEGNSAE
mgnify:CR=1 FL=1